MHLVELIPAAETEPALLDQLETFLVTTLGKGVVRAKDTPNFIANRVGVFSMLALPIHPRRTPRHRLIPIDALTGALIGRPKSATFRTADVVGLLRHVRACGQHHARREAPERSMAQRFRVAGVVPEPDRTQSSLGQKTRRGRLPEGRQ